MRVAEHGQERDHEKKIIFKHYHEINPRMFTPFIVDGVHYYLTDKALQGESGFWVMHGGGAYFEVNDDIDEIKERLESLYDIIRARTVDYLNGKVTIHDLQEILDLAAALSRLLYHWGYVVGSSYLDDFWHKLYDLFNKTGFEIEFRDVS